MMLMFTPCHVRDQFCSLVFTLSNLYFVACVYRGDFIEGSQRCKPSRAWPIMFFLSALPSIVRLVQSLKRYADSRLITHLINVRPCHQFEVPDSLMTSYVQGGKYGAGIFYYLFYAIWSSRGDHSHPAEKTLLTLVFPLGRGHHSSMALWCLSGTIYAIYASSWVRQSMTSFLH